MRKQIALRILVDMAIADLKSGSIDTIKAAKALYAAGVPLSVIGRVTEQAHQTSAEAGQRKASHTLSTTTEIQSRNRAKIALFS